jgi:hypothetical protein
MSRISRTLRIAARTASAQLQVFGGLRLGNAFIGFPAEFAEGHSMRIFWHRGISENIGVASLFKGANGCNVFRAVAGFPDLLAALGNFTALPGIMVNLNGHAFQHHAGPRLAIKVFLANIHIALTAGNEHFLNLLRRWVGKPFGRALNTNLLADFSDKFLFFCG